MHTYLPFLLCFIYSITSVDTNSQHKVHLVADVKLLIVSHDWVCPIFLSTSRLKSGILFPKFSQFEQLEIETSYLYIYVLNSVRGAMQMFFVKWKTWFHVYLQTKRDSSDVFAL